MKSPVSLTKIGNLKLGIINNGQPIQTEKILVTRPTKEGRANFKIFPGFDDNGESKVNVSLPFNKPELNFEVFYTGFLQIDEVEYIAKTEGIGKDLYFIPLYPDMNPEAEVILYGETSQEAMSDFGLERTGFLRAMVNGVSSYGEVFYLKTKSVNSIRAIQDQLKILNAITEGNVAGLPLVLKPVKKDIGEKQIIYVSIGFEGDIFETLNDMVYNAKEGPVNITALETLYEDERDFEEVIPYSEIKESSVIKVLSDGDSGITNIVTKEAVQSEYADYISEVLSSIDTKGIPTSQFEALFSSFKEDKQKFEEFLSVDKNVEVMTIVKAIYENTEA